VVGSIERVLAALNDAGVRYLVVGGVAVVLHGRLRTTADLDLVVQLDRENALRGIRALESLRYRPRAPVPAESFADEATRASWIRDKGMTVFSMSSAEVPDLEVDLFVSEPFPFEEVFARALAVPLTHTRARVIALEDLIAMKRAAGRPIDQDDVDGLEALRDQ
jgi:predicted nucleotidyltransferase